MACDLILRTYCNMSSSLHVQVMSTVWILMIMFGCPQSVFCNSKKKIFIGGLIPSYTNDRYGYQTALELAKETINNRSDILKDYEMIVKYGDTFVSSWCSVYLYVFLSFFIFSSLTKISYAISHMKIIFHV